MKAQKMLAVASSAVNSGRKQRGKWGRKPFVFLFEFVNQFYWPKEYSRPISLQATDGPYMYLPGTVSSASMHSYSPLSKARYTSAAQAAFSMQVEMPWACPRCQVHSQLSSNPLPSQSQGCVDEVSAKHHIIPKRLKRTRVSKACVAFMSPTYFYKIT